MAGITFYLNQAKIVKISILISYTISAIVLSLAFLLPLGVGVAIAWTILFLIRKKLNTTFFTLGISSKQLLIPFLTISLFITVLNFLYFEFAYPRAAYINRISYLESKNKPIQEGIVKNFWYRSKENLFIYFRLVDVHEKKAFDGNIFKADRNYNIIWFSKIPTATFLFKGNKILILTKNVVRYFPNRTDKLKKLSLEFKYNRKLLKVKEASFFSLLELYKLINQATSLNINKAYYLWELEKRLLLIFLSFWVPLYLFLSLFKLTDIKETTVPLFKTGGLTIFFILFTVFYQTLVNKLSLNPLYGILITIPYIGILIGKLREN